MIKIRPDLKPSDLTKKIARLWEASAPKILSIDKDDVPGQSAPVFTWEGKYTARGWTEWTQGFVYGSALLQYDATGDESFLKLGRDRTFERMAPHITHVGVHDHGFNNVSTYGNLLRLLHEGRIPDVGGREQDYLRTRAQAHRRGAGRPLDGNCRRRGVHLFFQRAALALCRHDPLVPRVGGFARARARSDGRARHENFTARPFDRPRPCHGEIQRLLWRRDATIMIMRGRVAHESVFNKKQRRLPLPEFATGFRAVHNVDARAGVDHVRLSRGTRMARHAG